MTHVFIYCCHYVELHFQLRLFKLMITPYCSRYGTQQDRKRYHKLSFTKINNIPLSIACTNVHAYMYVVMFLKIF